MTAPLEVSVLRITHWWDSSADPIKLPPSRTPKNARSRPPTRGVTIRTDTAQALAYWVTELITHAPHLADHHGVPDLFDVHAMCHYLGTHADTAREHLPDPRRCAQQLQHHADQIHTLAASAPNPGIKLGPCPVPTPDDGGKLTPCGATLYAVPAWNEDAPTHTGAGAYTPPERLTCPQCGTTDTIEGWRSRITGESRAVTSRQLRRELHARMGLVLSAQAIRHMVARGAITPIGQEAGENLFDLVAVLNAVKDRA